MPEILSFAFKIKVLHIWELDGHLAQFFAIVQINCSIALMKIIVYLAATVKYLNVIYLENVVM